MKKGHFLPHRGTFFYPVGIKLHPHRLGVEAMETDLNFNDVFPVACLHFHFTEVQRGPFLIQAVTPIHHLFSDCAFVGHARLAGNRAWPTKAQSENKWWIGVTAWIRNGPR